MEPDEVIMCTQGTLKKVHPMKTGTNSKGDWSLQNAILEHDGVEVPVLLANHDEIDKSWQGRSVTIEAYKPEGKAWTGVFSFDDTYGGKNERKIKVTATGQISLLEDPKPAPKSEPKAEPKHAEPKTQGQPKESDTQQPQQPQKGRMELAVEYANQDANLALLCINAVHNYMVPRVKEKLGIDLDDQAKHAWAMNLKIDMQKKGFENCMPTYRIIDKHKPVTAATPPPADAPTLPPGTTKDPETGEIRDKDGNFLF